MNCSTKSTNRALYCSHSILPKISSTRNVTRYNATKVCVQKSHILTFLTIAITRNCGLQDPSHRIRHLWILHYKLSPTIIGHITWPLNPITSSRDSFHMKYPLLVTIPIIFTTFCRIRCSLFFFSSPVLFSWTSCTVYLFSFFFQCGEKRKDILCKKFSWKE